MIDVGKAHLYAPIEGEVFVQLPPEMVEEGKCAKLLYTLYGMRTAASSWEREYTKTLVEAGFIVSECVRLLRPGPRDSHRGPWTMSW